MRMCASYSKLQARARGCGFAQYDVAVLVLVQTVSAMMNYQKRYCRSRRGDAVRELSERFVVRVRPVPGKPHRHRSELKSLGHYLFSYAP